MIDKPVFLSWEEAAAIIDSSSSMKDVVQATENQKPVQAFCQRCGDTGRWDIYHVSVLGKACIKHVKRSKTHCPHCTHALYWSKKYYLVKPALSQEHKKAREGLPLDE